MYEIYIPLGTKEQLSNPIYMWATGTGIDPFTNEQKVYYNPVVIIPKPEYLIDLRKSEI